MGVKDNVFLRDGSKCVYCEADLLCPTTTDEEPVRLTLDHITLASHGGPRSESNLVTCCNRCNSTRGDRDIVEWLVTLKPRDTYHGERAVRLVLRAMMSARRPVRNTDLERLLKAFPDIR